MAKFLDGEGLARLWEKMKAYVDSRIGGGGGSASGEIYSTEETRIGTWMDGKPLYRMVFVSSTPKTAFAWTDITPPIENVEKVTCISAVMNAGTYSLPVPFRQTEGNFALDLFYDYSRGVRMYVGNNENYIGKELYATIEFTKTTDQSVAFPAAALFPQETLDEMREAGLDKTLLDQQSID